MSPEDFRILASLVGFFGLGGMTLLGLRLVLGHRDKRLAAGGEDLRALRDDLQALRDEVAGIRGDVSELAERVDFAERVLARARDAEPGKLPGPQ